MTSMAKRLESIVDSRQFTFGVIVLIMLNAVIIGLETYPLVSRPFGDLLHTLDRIILWIFVLEISARWLAWREPRGFLLDGWNLFDVVIISIGFLPASTYVSVVRIFRVLRILRVVRVIPSMQRLVTALLKSFPALGHIILLMFILFYVYGVIGTFLYRDTAAQYFGSLHMSFLTLFQIATLENWPDVLAVLTKENHWAWIYIVSFILLGTFVVLNLVIGVIVSNLQAVDETHHKTQQEGPSWPDPEILKIQKSISSIESKLAHLLRMTSSPPGSTGD